MRKYFLFLVFFICSSVFAENISWHERIENFAASHSDAKVIYIRGFDYFKGKGVKQNYYEAFKWFQIAAQKGNDSAQNNLGYCYQYGLGVTQSREKALEWYQKAAKQGNKLAEQNFEGLLKTKIGPWDDEALAFKWFKQKNNLDLKIPST